MKLGLQRFQQQALLNYSQLEGDGFNNGKLAITFDDGWDSIYTTAFPLFVLYGAKFTFYVISDRVGLAGYCTWAQLKEMHDAGFDIQCHTQTHNYLTALTDEQIAAEMLAVDAAFVANGVPKPEHTAYPVGDYDNRVLNVIDNYRKTGRRTVGYPLPSLIDRKSNRYKLDSSFIGMPITDDFMTGIKNDISLAQTSKLAMIIFGHKIGDGEDALSAPAARIEELLIYGQYIGIDITTIKHIYSRMLYLDLRLERSGDDVINVHLTNQLSRPISIERSTDGVNFAEVQVLAAGERLFTDTELTLNTTYYYRAKCDGLPYSRVATANTTNTFTLTATGTGAGISKITLRAAETITITLTGDAKFYTDAAGTLGESSTWTIAPLERGILTTRYIRCASGVSTMKIPDNTIYQWYEWISAANAASLGGDISKMTALEFVVITGNNTINGSIAQLTRLTHFQVTGSNTLSGSIIGLSALIYIEVTGSNTLSGSISPLAALQYINIAGVNTCTYETVILLKGLCYINISENIITSENINQLLADFWANRDEQKLLAIRTIGLYAKFGSGKPTGQGLIDKAALQEYRSPNMEEDKALWTVSTRT